MKIENSDMGHRFCGFGFLVNLRDGREREGKEDVRLYPKIGILHQFIKPNRSSLKLTPIKP
jgi:hypothetical protein